jgi:hypothetical protein
VQELLGPTVVPEHLFALTGVGHLDLLGPLTDPVQEEFSRRLADPMRVIQGLLS